MNDFPFVFSLPHCRRWGILLITAVFLWITAVPRAAVAQQDDAYWQYDAQGRLDQILTADVDNDGIDEFLVVSGQDTLALVGADGGARWERPPTEETIVQIGTADVDGADDGALEIVVGTRTQLILLDASGRVVWQISLVSAPLQIDRLDYDRDGRDEILIATRIGRTQLFTGHDGRLIWSYVGDEPPNVRNADPRLAVADFNRDGFMDVAFAYVTQSGFGAVTLLNGEGELIWSRAADGRITALTDVRFAAETGTNLAVGTSRGVVYVYSGPSGSLRWFRTPNRAVTALAVADLSRTNLPDRRRSLVVGTAAGTALAYDGSGRRLWDRIYGQGPNQPVLGVSAAPLDGNAGNQPVRLAVMLQPPRPAPAPLVIGEEATTADVLLLNSDGRPVSTFPAASVRAVSQLVDVNRDGFVELLLASFATVSLRDPGLRAGDREYVTAWSYRLEARPSVMQPVTIDDNDNRLLIGGADGRLHLISTRTGEAAWATTFPGVVSTVAIARPTADEPPLVVVAHNAATVDERGLEVVQGRIEVIDLAGRRLWAEPLTVPTSITAVRVADINGNLPPEILVGTNDGQVRALSLAGREFWQITLDGAITQLEPVDGEDQRPQIVVGTAVNKLYLLDNKGRGDVRAEYVSAIAAVFGYGPILPVAVVTANGGVRGLDATAAALASWQFELNSSPQAVVKAGNGVAAALEDGRLVYLNLNQILPLGELWSVAAGERVTSLQWGDINGDARSDLVVGNRLGGIDLYTGEGELFGQVSLSSGIFDLAAIDTGRDHFLVAAGDDGVVHRLEAQANRPPLLINPQTTAEPGRYGINVTVLDADRDEVAVNLLVFDPDLGEWVIRGERVASRGNEVLFWVVDDLGGGRPVRYRFDFNDGVYYGQVTPTVGPAPQSAAVIPAPVMIVLLALLLVGGGVWMRQSMASVSWRSGRFYRQILLASAETLSLLHDAYARTRGSPDLLLNLAQRARRDGRTTLAGLADGLFLLADRTPAGLAVIIEALDEVAADDRPWDDLALWRQIFEVSYRLITVQSVFELGLLRQRLVVLVAQQTVSNVSLVPFDALMRPMTSLRDSARVSRADDRLSYLHEAAVLLQQEQAVARRRPVTIQNTIVQAILSRWQGLVNAGIADLRGRAWLTVSLKTKRLVPDQETGIALDVRNSGQAAAERVEIKLLDDLGYSAVNGVQTIPYLPADQTRTVNWTISPHEHGNLRLAFTVSYRDAKQRIHSFEFADMVRLLGQDRSFEPIVNPYSPGTPLRRESHLFVGREALLDFIVAHSSRPDQQNVIILVGQRRTGKTSALLRLEKTAPDALLAVYVDCQSLGVVPGMVGFLQDLAWLLADALEVRGYEIEVPDTAEWEHNPAHFFQRVFLPQVQALLPAETRLLLIFDEFEAFENLVQDGLLPPTFFPFLRHLMQHEHGLNFVFAGTHRLEEMGTDYWSVLFNIGVYRQIGYLERESAVDLVTKPVAPQIVYDDLALDKIWRVTAGHPYFLQLVCYALVNRANEQKSGYVTISDVNQTVKEMLRLGEAHFAYLWQQSSFVERALLTAVAHLHDDGSLINPNHLLQRLHEYDLHLDSAETQTALRSLVTRGIMAEVQQEGVTVYRVRIGLVEMWVAENKSVSKLYEAGER